MTTTTEPTDVDRLADVAVAAWNREECVEAGRQAACATEVRSGDAYFRACMAYVVRAVLDAQPPRPQAPDLVGVLLDVAVGREQYAQGAPKEAARVLRNEAAAYRTAAELAAGDRTGLPFLLPSWEWSEQPTPEPVDPPLRGKVVAAVMAVARDLTTGDAVRTTDAVLAVTEEDKRAAVRAVLRDAQDTLNVSDESHTATIAALDHANGMADRLALALAPEEARGGFTTGDDLWQRALDHAESTRFYATVEAPTADPVEPAHFVVPVPSQQSARPLITLLADGTVTAANSWGLDVRGAREEIRRQQAREHVMRSLRRTRRGRSTAPASGWLAGHPTSDTNGQRESRGIVHRTASGAAALTVARLRRAGAVR